MRLSEAFSEGGIGVIATASGDSVVNQAIYAVSEVLDGGTLVFAMTKGETWENLLENPNAAYLYISPEGKFSGLRLTLRLSRMESTGSLLERKRKMLADIIGPGEAGKLKHLAYFEVVEVRPLV